MESMKLHEAVLASRSPYFLRALTSGFHESTDKTLQLKDAEAVKDIKLLLKLAYTASYAEDKGRPLDKPQLLRLLRLADAYEMPDCVVECAVALCPVADYDEAVQICQAIPDSVLSHKGLARLLKDGEWGRCHRQGAATRECFVDAGNSFFGAPQGMGTGRKGAQPSCPRPCSYTPKPMIPNSR